MAITDRPSADIAIGGLVNVSIVIGVNILRSFCVGCFESEYVRAEDGYRMRNKIILREREREKNDHEII